MDRVIGSETAHTQRQREYIKRKKEREASLNDAGVTQMLQVGDVEIEKEIEIEIDKDIEKEKKVKEKKPTKNPIGVDIYKMLDDSDLNDDIKAEVTEWLTYKVEQFKFSYKPTGFKAFLTEIHNNELTLGTENVCKAISLSMGKGYKGIIWDLVKKEQPKSSAYMDAIKNRVNVVDSWT